MDKNVTPEQKGIFVQTELAKRAVLRLNNQESNQLTKECISMAMMYLMRDKHIGNRKKGRRVQNRFLPQLHFKG